MPERDGYNPPSVDCPGFMVGLDIWEPLCNLVAQLYEPVQRKVPFHEVYICTTWHTVFWCISYGRVYSVNSAIDKLFSRFSYLLCTWNNACVVAGQSSYFLELLV